MNDLFNDISLLTANVTLYKWLLGGGIALMALLGLVFFGMLALQVLQQEEPSAAPSAEGEEAAVPPAEEPAAESAAADGVADEQEGGQL